MQKAETVRPSKPDRYSALNAKLDHAVKVHQQGQLAEAERIYREILQQQPKNFVALHLLGVIAQQAGHPEAAVKLIKMAITLHPNGAPAHSNLGRALLDLKRPEDALASFDQSIAIDPKFAMGHNNRGKALIDLKRPEEALTSFDTAITLDPQLLVAHINRGKALMDLDRSEEALPCLQKAVHMNPDSAEAWLNLGCAFNKLDRWEEAEDACRRAIKLNPQLPLAWTNLAMALNQFERWDEAAAACRTAVRLQPDYEDAWNPLAYALIALRRFEEAETAARRAVELNPEDTNAFINLGRALAALNRTSELIQVLRRISELTPNPRGPAEVNEANLRNLYEHVTRLIEDGRTAGDSFLLTAVQIRELHGILLKDILPSAGEYRREYVMIGACTRIPPHWTEVPRLVDEMCDYVNSNWRLAEGIHLAAFISWNLNFIHPFLDGNGRISRALCYALLAIKDLSLPVTNSSIASLVEPAPPDYVKFHAPAYDTYSQAGDISKATAHVEPWLRLFRERLLALTGSVSEQA